MKSSLLFLLLCLGPLISAQAFIEAPQDSPFENVSSSSIAFADVDNDNDPDVLITGRSGITGWVTKLYTNAGGDYTEVPDTPFEAVSNGSVAFADVDGDNDLDVFITGWNSSFEAKSTLYLNDGGNFTEVFGDPFEDVMSGTIAFSDVDNDNDPDLLITGSKNIGGRITKLYINEEGTFTEVSGLPVTDVSQGGVAFADIDDDNDADLLITGLTNTGNSIAKLYHNDGGQFTEVVGTPFEGVAFSSVAFADVDGDNDLDVLIAGQSSPNVGSTKLYTNNEGNFTEVLSTPFEGVSFCSVAFSDVDRDNDPDLLITGRTTTFDSVSKLYTNDGGGNFTEVPGVVFEQVSEGALAFADVDGDDNPDVLITGYQNPSTKVSKLYLNDYMVDIKEAKKMIFDFSLFPNPTGVEELQVSYSAEKNRRVMVSVFDLNGRLIMEKEERVGIGSQTFFVEIGKLNTGSYLLQLTDGERIGVRQFLVE